MGLFNLIKSIFNSLSLSEAKTCGIKKLDELLLPLGESNRDTHIVIIDHKSMSNSKIREFVNSYASEAKLSGGEFIETFSEYPSDKAKNVVYEAWDEIHIMRPDEFNLGMAGWLPELSLEYTTLIGNMIHPLIVGEASFMLACENGENTSSIDIWPTCAIFCVWLKECKGIFERLPQIFKNKKPIKVYYKGQFRKLSFLFLFFLSRIGCNILIEPNKKINIQNLLKGMPEYVMKRVNIV